MSLRRIIDVGVTGVAVLAAVGTVDAHVDYDGGLQEAYIALASHATLVLALVYAVIRVTRSRRTRSDTAAPGMPGV